jgi:hypothetical protein
MLDPVSLEKLNQQEAAAAEPDTFLKYFGEFYQKPEGEDVPIRGEPRRIDLSSHGPYANYNWELLFHVPLSIAVHLSSNQRFAEAQQWFHLVFDPTRNDSPWRFLGFREAAIPLALDELLRLLSKPESECTDTERERRQDFAAGVDASRGSPFQPHAIARTRPIAYQYYVVMKYLDNLIAWGDSLFRQDTVESINEAKVCAYYQQMI